MSTVRKKLENMLGNMGMFPNQAEAVIAEAIPVIDGVDIGYQMKWDDPEDAYPEAVYTVLFLYVRPVALAWIEKNAPMAWFKEMFID